MNHIKKAFTLTELIVVVAIIWILMMWLTVYIWWLWERARIIEAQWCAASLWWQMNNYVFNALTSKSLITPNNEIVSPDRYIITLGWWTSTDTRNCSLSAFRRWIYCNELRFLYTENNDSTQQLYKTYTIWNTCRQNQAKIWLYRRNSRQGWPSDIKFISMNKWFAPRSISERNVFYLQEKYGAVNERQLTEGEIIVVLCSNNECKGWREVGKYHVDGRTQTISFKKCIFYREDNKSCAARED